MTTHETPVMLVILDGFGLGDVNDPCNAVVQANPTTFMKLWDTYPHTTLEASGMAVGLPEGQMGNSEVGHLNIGAGRIVYQELTRITKEVDEGTFFERPVVKAIYDKAQGHALHIVGLLSDGGVHSSLDHIKAAIRGAKEAGLTKVYVHALLDGRDVPPQSALTYIEDIERYMKDLGVGQIATIGGRYYGMDRDKRWERVQQAYDAMTGGTAPHAASATEVVAQSYATGITDEFVVPTVVQPEGMVQDGDVVWFCNFRPDRARQLTRAFVDPDFTGFERQDGQKDVFFATMTVYEEELPVHVVYGKELIENTLGEVVSREGYQQLRIAETEKYAHVTYFMNGGREETFTGEDRILVPSPKVATYDLQPAMSAVEVTDRVVAAIHSGTYRLIILNYANTDMVGHTGNLEAAKEAVRTVNACLERVAEAILAEGGHLLITADHGNAEKMMDHESQTPHTAHTTNPVPCILVSEAFKKARLVPGKLSDIAPTLLTLANLPIPAEMSGTSLIQQEEE